MPTALDQFFTIFSLDQHFLASSVHVQLRTEFSLIITVIPTRITPPARASLFEPLLDQELKFGMEALCNQTWSTRQPPAGLPEMPWLAMIILFWSYLSHFKTDFDCVKSKVGLFNIYNQSSYLANHQLVFQKSCVQL